MPVHLPVHIWRTQAKCACEDPCEPEDNVARPESVSASRGYGRAGTQNDCLAEAVMLGTGTSIPAQRTRRRQRQATLRSTQSHRPVHMWRTQAKCAYDNPSEPEDEPHAYGASMDVYGVLGFLSDYAIPVIVASAGCEMSCEESTQAECR